MLWLDYTLFLLWLLLDRTLFPLIPWLGYIPSVQRPLLDRIRNALLRVLCRNFQRQNERHIDPSDISQLINDVVALKVPVLRQSHTAW